MEVDGWRLTGGWTGGVAERIGREEWLRGLGGRGGGMDGGKGLGI